MTDVERKSGEEEVYLFSGMEIVVVIFFVVFLLSLKLDLI